MSERRQCNGEERWRSSRFQGFRLQQVGLEPLPSRSYRIIEDMIGVRNILIYLQTGEEDVLLYAESASCR